MPQSPDPTPDSATSRTTPGEWPHHDLWTAELLELIAHAAKDCARALSRAENRRSP